MIRTHKIWECDCCEKKETVTPLSTCIWPEGFIKFQVRAPNKTIPEFLVCSFECLMKLYTKTMEAT